MQATPIHLNGPFTLLHQQGYHVIVGKDKVPICELTGQLIDGSGRDIYPNKIIRTREDRQAEAQWVVNAMNAAFAAQRCSSPGDPLQ